MSSQTEEWEDMDLTEDDTVVFADEMEDEEEANHTDTPQGCFAVTDDEEN